MTGRPSWPPPPAPRVEKESTRGYGAALLRGIRSARGRVIVMADADCTYPLDDLAQIAGPVLRGEAELVLGSRLGSATRESMPLLHRFVGTPVLTWLVRAGTGVGDVSDSQSGFRAFNRDLVYRLGLPAPRVWSLLEMLRPGRPAKGQGHRGPSWLPVSCGRVQAVNLERWYEAPAADNPPVASPHTLVARACCRGPRLGDLRGYPGRRQWGVGGFAYLAANFLWDDHGGHGPGRRH